MRILPVIGERYQPQFIQTTPGQGELFILVPPHRVTLSSPSQIACGRRFSNSCSMNGSSSTPSQNHGLYRSRCGGPSWWCLPVHNRLGAKEPQEEGKTTPSVLSILALPGQDVAEIPGRRLPWPLREVRLLGPVLPPNVQQAKCSGGPGKTTRNFPS